MHEVTQVRPVEAERDLGGIAEAELRNDVVPYPARGAGGKGGDRDRGETLAQHAELAVFRPELVAPLRNAVRLVDREELERNAAEPSQRVVPDQTLRREIKERVLALFGA